MPDVSSVADAVQTARANDLDHQPVTIAELQTLLDCFVEDYNHRRPHRSLPHRATPALAYTARPKAIPGDH
jgi:transposase InsO family protein